MFGEEAVDRDKSTIDRNTTRLNRRLVGLAKKLSTVFNHEHDVGVKWKIQRGWRMSHWRTFGWHGVIVQDGVDDLAGWDFVFDRVEEAMNY